MISIEKRLEMVFKKLRFLGYQGFQIKQIVKEALGDRSWEKNNQEQNQQILQNLKKYENLGNEYLLAYSK